MKPQSAIATVVVAVLATIVIEESRIARMRKEILRLQALPTDTAAIEFAEPPPERPGKAIPPAENPDPDADPDAQVLPDPDAAPRAGGDPKPTRFRGLRTVPDDYPEPDPERIKRMALGTYSNLYRELALTPRESAFFDDLLLARDATQQDLAMKWLEATPDQRPATAQEMADSLSSSDQNVRAFLGRESDFETFAAFIALQPERQLLAQLSPMMEAANVALELDKEQKLVEAMHRARVGTGSLDWTSPDALAALAAGGAAARFESEWARQDAALKPEVAKFLSAAETAAFFEAREQLGASTKASLADAEASLGQ